MKKNKKKSKAVSAAKKSPGPRPAVSPLSDRILLRPLSADEAGTATSFGIIIPDSAKEKPEQGTVIAVGPGKRTDDGKIIPVSVKVGERVMFSKYGYDEVKIGGVEYYLVSETNVLAIINK